MRGKSGCIVETTLFLPQIQANVITTLFVETGVFGCIFCSGISLVRRKGIFCVLVFAYRRLIVSFLLEISFLYLLRTSSCFSGFLFWVLTNGSFLVVEVVSGSLIVIMEDKVGGGFSHFFNLLDISDLNGEINGWINLASLQSSRSKLAKIKV